MLVKDAMASYAAWLDVGRSVREAAQLMQKLDVGCLPVTDAGRVVGLITDRDIVCRIVADGHDADTQEVGAVMSGKVVSCIADQTLTEAAELMEANRVRRMPVVDEQGRIIGLLSVDDVARYADYQVTGELMHILCLPIERRL